LLKKEIRRRKEIKINKTKNKAVQLVNVNNKSKFELHKNHSKKHLDPKRNKSCEIEL